MARSALTDKVLPAFRDLRAFYVAQYLPACHETSGAASRTSWPKAYIAAIGGPLGLQG